MKHFKTILALLLCLCMLPLSAFAYTVDQAGGTHTATVYTPSESGLYAVTVTKGGETLSPLPAKAAVYEPAMTVSVKSGGVDAQAVDYNVFWLEKGKSYTVQLENVSDGAYDDSGEWTVSVAPVKPQALTLNADTLLEGEWFTFTPETDGSFTFAAAPAPVFVEVMTVGAVSGDWAGYALDKEKCRVGMELDYLRSLKAAIALRAEELDLAEDAYNKALNKLDNYNDLIDLANKTGIGGEDSNLGNKKQAVYDALKHILGNNGNLFELGLIRGLFPNLNLPTLDPEVVADMPDNVEAFPDWLSARLQSQNGLVGEAKTKYEDLKAEQAEDQARYDAGLAANPQLAALIEDTNVETATLRQQVQTDADAILSSASALAADSGMQLVAAKWLNTEDAALTLSLSKDTTYVIHALSNLETSATVTDGTADPDDPDDPDDPPATDKSLLEKLIASASAIDLSNYTDESAAGLQDAIEKAKEALNNENADPSAITDALQKLKDAIAALEVKPEEPDTVNKTALNEAIAKAEAVDTSKYTEDSVSSMNTALAAAKAAQAKADATQAEVDKAAQDLNAAVAALEEKPVTPTVDKTALNAAIAAAEQVDRSKYTAASLAEMDAALTAAKAVLGADSVPQAGVDNATKALNDAIAGLKEKDVTPPVSGVDKTALQQAVDAAKAIDRTKYTDDSLAALDTQVQNAEALLANDSATQAQVNLATRRVNNAISALKEKTAPQPVKFVDVPETAYYADAVDWAVENGITNGKDATHFAPKDDCTRAQIVTFLWRTAGEPEPATTVNPFVDVNPSAYYYKAVLWAVGEGITNGTDATHFSPNATCTRAHAVTFLWRMEGEPMPTNSRSSFADVQDMNAYYYYAVMWAVENGITNGTDPTHFSPKQTCSRAQIVTFLYRDKVGA